MNLVFKMVNYHIKRMKKEEFKRIILKKLNKKILQCKVNSQDAK